MNPNKIMLVNGIGDGETTACLMSARALLDGRGLTDDHPSRVLRKIGLCLNDGPWWTSNAERTATLMPLALDDRLCASRCDASPAAEARRAELCARWALEFAAPEALEAAGRPDLAARLRAEPTEENARAAWATGGACAAACGACAWAARTAARAYAREAKLALSAAAESAVAASRAAAAVAAAWAAADSAKIRDSLIELFKQTLDVK